LRTDIEVFCENLEPTFPCVDQLLTFLLAEIERQCRLFAGGCSLQPEIKGGSRPLLRCGTRSMRRDGLELRLRVEEDDETVFHVADQEGTVEHEHKREHEVLHGH